MNFKLFYSSYLKVAIIMNGFEKRKQQKEQHILQVATDRFIKDGIALVTVASIAKEAQVSQVTIYKYFDTKKQLLNATLQYYLAEEFAKFEQLIVSPLTFQEKLLQLVQRKQVFSQQIHPEYYAFMMETYQNNPVAFADDMTRSYALYQQFFEQGKAEGVVSKTLSNEALVMYLDMAVHYFEKDGVANQIRPYIDEFTEIFFHGLAGKPTV